MTSNNAELNYACIAALDESRGIGRAGDIPWHIPADLAHFRKLTSQAHDERRNAVIMGRKTWDSIPPRYRPLDHRVNIVLSRKPPADLPSKVHGTNSLEQALALCMQLKNQSALDKIFVIGGAQLYEQAVVKNECTQLFLTRINANFDCDVFFPEFESFFHRSACSSARQHNDITYFFEEYTRKQSAFRCD